MNDKIAELTNAVYKLLEYFPEADQIKNRAKEKTLAIMSAHGARLPAGQGFPGRGENSIQEDIDILLNYFLIAKSQGWISGLNYLIVANEYKKIKDAFCPAIELPTITEPVTQNPPSPRHNGVTARQRKIIDFLSKNEKAQVMELQNVLGNVTKRTIRRDLDELLQAGKVARFGEFNQVFYKLA